MRKTLLFVFLLISCTLFAQVPSYYSDIDFTQPPAHLQQQLSVLVIDTHQYLLTYTPEVWNVLKIADLEQGTYNVLLLYGYNNSDGVTKTDRTRDKDLNCTSSSCIGLWNREHVYPKSLANPTLDTSYPGAGTDAHALRACDSQMNSSRSNRPYEAGTGNSYITASGNFYPGDEWIGDVARIIMYMHIRYPSQCNAVMVGMGPATYDGNGEIPNIFLEWNEQDPVSNLEIQRNNVISSYQGNRNPFIDNPYLATMLWNGPQAEETWGTLTTPSVSVSQFVAYPTQTSDYVYIKSLENSEFTYTVYNVMGQEIITGETVSKIDLSPYKSGIYFIQLRTGSAKQTLKIIVN